MAMATTLVSCQGLVQAWRLKALMSRCYPCAHNRTCAPTCVERQELGGRNTAAVRFDVPAAKTGLIPRTRRSNPALPEIESVAGADEDDPAPHRPTAPCSPEGYVQSCPRFCGPANRPWDRRARADAARILANVIINHRVNVSANVKNC